MREFKELVTQALREAIETTQNARENGDNGARLEGEKASNHYMNILDSLPEVDSKVMEEIQYAMGMKGISDIDKENKKQV